MVPILVGAPHPPDGGRTALPIAAARVLGEDEADSQMLSGPAAVGDSGSSREPQEPTRKRKRHEEPERALAAASVLNGPNAQLAKRAIRQVVDQSAGARASRANKLSWSTPLVTSECEAIEFDTSDEGSIAGSVASDGESSGVSDEEPSGLDFGSADPHLTGDLPTQRSRRPSCWKAAEPELPGVLARESLPDDMVPHPTTFFTPQLRPEPPPHELPPTPQDYFDPAYLVEFQRYCKQVGRAWKLAADPAYGRPEEAWRRAKQIRPNARMHDVEEEVQPRYRRLGAMDFTDCLSGGKPKILQPSCYPDNPPETELDPKEILYAAGTHGVENSRYGEVYPDQQGIGYLVHGFEAHSIAPRKSQWCPPHLGAFKDPAALRKCVQKDRDAGYVMPGFTQYPPFSHARALPCNVVWRKGKPRMTIDPGFQPFVSLLPPNTVDNDFLPGCVFTRITSLCRAGAIFLVVFRVPADTWGGDGSSYYRVHGAQRKDMPLYTLMLYDGVQVDLRPNFGATLLPQNIGMRGSGFLVWCIKRELKAFDLAHPPSIPSILHGLEQRRAVRATEAPELTDETDFLYAVLFYVAMMIDDIGAVSVSDPIHEDGELVIWTPEGCARARPKRRSDFHYEIAVFTVMPRLGYPVAADKSQPPWIFGQKMVQLGAQVEMSARRRSVDPARREAYANECDLALAQSESQNYDQANSLYHKLLNASESTQGGRQHLFHVGRCLRAKFRLRRNAVRWSPAAVEELKWHAAQLRLPEPDGLPLASRRSIPEASDDGVGCFYGDSSRENPEGARRVVEKYGRDTDQPTPSHSGWGGWTVIGDVFYYTFGTWSAWEVAELIIAVTEFATQDILLFTFARFFGRDFTHFIEYTDNEASEGASHALLSRSVVIQELVRRRQRFLQKRRIFTQPRRITSKANRWADMLSRGDVEAVLQEVRAKGLKIVFVTPDPEARDLTVLRGPLAQQRAEAAITPHLSRTRSIRLLQNAGGGGSKRHPSAFHLGKEFSARVDGDGPVSSPALCPNMRLRGGGFPERQAQALFSDDPIFRAEQVVDLVARAHAWYIGAPDALEGSEQQTLLRDLEDFAARVCRRALGEGSFRNQWAHDDVTLPAHGVDSFQLQGGALLTRGALLNVDQMHRYLDDRLASVVVVPAQQVAGSPNAPVWEGRAATLFNGQARMHLSIRKSGTRKAIDQELRLQATLAALSLPTRADRCRAEQLAETKRTFDTRPVVEYTDFGRSWLHACRARRWFFPSRVGTATECGDLAEALEGALVIALDFEGSPQASPAHDPSDSGFKVAQCAWIKGDQCYVVMDYVDTAAEQPGHWLRRVVLGSGGSAPSHILAVWGSDDIREIQRLRHLLATEQGAEMPHVQDVQALSPATVAGVPHGAKLDVAFSVTFRPVLHLHGARWSVEMDQYWPSDQRREAAGLQVIGRQFGQIWPYDPIAAGAWLEVWLRCVIPLVVGFSKQPKVQVNCLKKPGTHLPGNPAYVDYRSDVIHEAMPRRVRGRDRVGRVEPVDRDGSIYAFTDPLATLLLALRTLRAPRALASRMVFHGHSLPVVFAAAAAPDEADLSDPAWTEDPISWEPWWDETVQPRPTRGGGPA